MPDGHLRGHRPAPAGKEHATVYPAIALSGHCSAESSRVLVSRWADANGAEDAFQKKGTFAPPAPTDCLAKMNETIAPAHT